jgi:hypothetical protein
MDEGCSTIITPLWSTGIGIEDDWESESESETTVVWTTVISSSLCKVAPLLRIDREIGLAVDEIWLVSDTAHGTAISCRRSLSGGRGDVAVKARYRDASRTPSESNTENEVGPQLRDRQRSEGGRDAGKGGMRLRRLGRSLRIHSCIGRPCLRIAHDLHQQQTVLTGMCDGRVLSTTEDGGHGNLQTP